MKRKVLGGVLLLVLIVGVSLGRGELFAQSYAPSPPSLPSLPSLSTEEDRELAKINQRTQELAAQLRGKPDAAKEAELKKLVEEAFAKRHAAQVAEAKALADKLAKLQELLKKREEKKAEIVARRVKQLLGESDDLDWNPNTHQATPYLPPQWNQLTQSWIISTPEGPVRLLEGSGRPEITVNPVPNPPNQKDGSGQSRPTPNGATPLLPTVQGQRPRIVEMDPELPGNPKRPTDDLKTLEIEVQLAKTRLKEAVTELDHYTKGEAKLPERLDTLRFAVEKQRLEVDLAVRRLEIATKEQKNAKPNVPSPAP